MYGNLKAEMTRYGFTNSDIARTLGINVSTVTAKLNVESRLKFCEARRIQESLFPALTVDYLFGDENPSPPDKRA